MSLTLQDKQDVREIVSEEIDKSPTIKSLQEEQQRQGVLLEHVEGKMDTVLELLSSSLKIETVSKNHENRIKTLEKEQQVIGSTLKLHSKQLLSL